MEVPFTSTFTPGIGVLSSAEVILPVTVKSSWYFPSSAHAGVAANRQHRHARRWRIIFFRKILSLISIGLKLLKF
jgi:hypothetical protein